ncbi:MAG: DNA-binding protein [Lachnospiraceae bacterium]|nr:DNA-binding protein [Lachnospiraceae bacterium]
MNTNYMVTAQDVVDMLGVSKGHTYKIIRQLNKELEDNGYIVVAGKIPKVYWDKKFYGYQSGVTTA